MAHSSPTTTVIDFVGYGGMGVVMRCEWKECLVGDVVTLKRGYDLPKSKREVGTVPIVSSSGISDFHHQSMVEGPGVVTGRYGTIGNVYFVKEDFFPLNTTLYVQDFKGNDKSNCPHPWHHR